MKKFKNFIAIALAAFWLVAGCQSLPVIESATPGIVSGVTQLVVSLVVKDDATKFAISNDMHAWAVACRSLMNGQVPTAEQLTATLDTFSVTPGQYVNLLPAVGALWASYYPKIEGDAKTAMDVLEWFAEGFEEAAVNIKPQGT